MTSVTLNLDGDALREATVNAMIGVLTPEVQQSIIKQAIDSILKPSTDSWNKGKSPLLIAFESAITQFVNQSAREMVANDPELRAKLDELLKSTALKVLNTDVDVLAERMASAFASSMRG